MVTVAVALKNWPFAMLVGTPDNAMSRVAAAGVGVRVGVFVGVRVGVRVGEGKGG